MTQLRKILPSWRRCRCTSENGSLERGRRSRFCYASIGHGNEENTGDSEGMTNFDDFVAEADTEEERRQKQIEKETRIEEADSSIPEEQVDPEPSARVKVVINVLVKCSNCGNIFDTTSVSDDIGRGYCPKCGVEGFVKASETPESTKHSPHIAIQTVKTGRVNGKSESTVLEEADPHLPSTQQAKEQKEEDKKGRRKERNAEMFIDP